jgi:hypothetical protein
MSTKKRTTAAPEPKPIDAEAQRLALEVELAYVLQRAPFPTSIAIAARAARIADLEAKLRELPPRPLAPLTGMAAGMSCTVCDTRLGTGYARPDPAENESRHSHNDDPMIREYGHDIQ